MTTLDDQPSPAAPRRLPRGRSALPRPVVLESQRARLLEAMVRAVAEKGYPAVTVADVTAGAGVSRGAFYEHFSDKEECFLAAYRQGARVHFERVVAAGSESTDVRESYLAGVRAYLQTLAESPDWSRTFLVEVFAAGKRAMELRRETHDRYALLLKATHQRWREEELPDLPVLPDEIYDAAVAAVNELAVNWIERGDAQRLPELEAVVTYIDLALLGLQRPAVEVAPRARPRRRRRAAGA